MGWMLLTAMLLHLSPDPFTYASQATEVPVQLLMAVSRVESSHHPWALNIEGKAVYPGSREEAEKILQQSPDTVDIGHMQVNYRIWGERLGLTKTQLLDPYINAWAGAMILQYYFTQYPFWEAIGRYHSVDRDRQIGYAWQVYEALLPASRPSSLLKRSLHEPNGAHQPPASASEAGRLDALVRPPYDCSFSNVS